MRALAGYAMRSRFSAMTVTTACAVLALPLMPLTWPISYLSSGSVGLVTLVQGPGEGLLNIAGAALLLALLAAVVLGDPLLAFGFVLVVWLPAWLLALVLRQTAVLAWGLLLAGGLGAAVVLGAYAVLPSPAQSWHAYFVEFVLPAFEQAGVQLAQDARFDAYLQDIARYMTGVMGGFLALGAGIGLLVARWWQSALYRPGAFREEFHGLRLGRPLAWGAAVLAALALASVGGLGELTGNLLIVAALLFVFQGLALAHAVVAQLHAHTGWLVGVYGLLFVVPQFLLLVSAAGCLDNWFNFRARIRPRDA